MYVCKHDVCHWKVKSCVISDCFRCSPLDTRSPLDYEMSLHNYTTYVNDILGLGVGNRVVKA